MRAFVCGAALTLAACSGSEEQARDGSAATNAAAEASAEPEPALVNETAEPHGREAAFDWTGTFAARPELCRGGAWRFARERVETDGETACTVGAVRPSATSVELALSCTAEGMASEEVWTLTPTGDGAMTVSRDIGPEVVEVDLRRCG